MLRTAFGNASSSIGPTSRMNPARQTSDTSRTFNRLTIARSYVVRDSATMLRRNLRHAVRYPSVTLVVVALPIVLLLLFVYVLGGTLGAGLGVVSDDHGAYVDYVTPGIVPARWRTGSLT